MIKFARKMTADKSKPVKAPALPEVPIDRRKRADDIRNARYDLKTVEDNTLL